MAVVKNAILIDSRDNDIGHKEKTMLYKRGEAMGGGGVCVFVCYGLVVGYKIAPGMELR